jgi:hypothetical protein
VVSRTTQLAVEVRREEEVASLSFSLCMYGDEHYAREVGHVGEAAGPPSG